MPPSQIIPNLTSCSRSDSPLGPHRMRVITADATSRVSSVASTRRRLLGGETITNGDVGGRRTLQPLAFFKAWPAVVLAVLTPSASFLSVSSTLAERRSKMEMGTR
jgi:hypothetical protein